MNEEKATQADLTIDLKRSRFRIFKKTLNLLGNPSYIQFLVNPEELFIAILGSDKPLAGGTCNRVSSDARSCVEFYSSTLMDSIFNIFGALDFRCSYHLTGDVDTVNRVAYFSLRTIKKNERGTKHGRKGL